MARRKTAVSIIGAGVVARAVGRLLAEGGFAISSVWSRTPSSTRSAVEFIGGGRAARSAAPAAKSGEVVLLAVSDDAIQPLCEQIAGAKGFRRGAVVIHFSGALGSSVLDAARACRAHVASLHPLQSFPSPDEALKRMKGTFFSFEGAAAAEPAAQRIVEALGGRLMRLTPGSKALYHAACCVISNYTVAMADLGLALMELAGLSRKDALRAVMPLLSGTVRNVAEMGTPAALTGPIARGDVRTVERHLEALRALPPAIRRLYCEVGLYAIRVGQRKGSLEAAAARRLWHVLSLEERGR